MFSSIVRRAMENGLRVSQLRTRSDAKTSRADYLAVLLVPGKCCLNKTLHEEWREERNEGETGKGPLRALHGFAQTWDRNTFVLQVHQLLGSPWETKNLFFKSRHLKISPGTSLLYRCGPNLCACGLQGCRLHMQPVVLGLRFQLPRKRELGNSLNISH